MWRALVVGLVLIVTSAGASVCPTCLKFCEKDQLYINSVNIGEKYTFTSPDYTAQSNSNNCSILLYINETHNGTVLYIKQYDSTKCPRDFNLTNHNGQVVNNKMEEYCSSSGLCITTALLEKGKHATFHVPVSDQQDPFNFTIQVFPLNSMKSSDTDPRVVNVTSAPFGYIRSHSQISLNGTMTLVNNKFLVLSNFLDIGSISIRFVYGNLTNDNSCHVGGETALVKFNAGSTALAQFFCDNISNMVNNIALPDNTNNISLSVTLPTNYPTSGFLLYYSTNSTDENLDQMSNPSCPLSTQTTSSTSSTSSALITKASQPRASSFFDKPEHIIAVATGGGFVLICVIVGLVCLLTRNR